MSCRIGLGTAMLVLAMATLGLAAAKTVKPVDSEKGLREELKQIKAKTFYHPDGHVQSVVLAKTNFQNHHLEKLTQFKKLEWVNLNGTRVNPDQLRILQKIRVIATTL